MLLQYGLAVNQKCCRDETTPLHFAVASAFGSESVHLPQLLLQHGADREAKNALGETPLSLAAAKNGGNFSLVQFFLLEGYTADEKDKFGKTPLMKAVRNAVVPGSTTIVEVLLQHGSSVNTIDQYGRSPLHFIPSFAGVAGAEIFQLLLDYGPDVNLSDDNGETPLHAAAAGNSEIVERLLQQGSTPLHLAAVFCDSLGSVDEEYDMIFLLLKHGANVNLRDSEGSIPLHTAAAFGEIRFVRKLIFAGSDVNLLDVRGDTPLTVVRLLVDNGADLFAVNKQGLTPAMCAKKFGHKEVEQYLDQRPDMGV